MKLALTLLLSTFSLISFGQKVRYLNQNFVQVNYKDQASYYTETLANGPSAGTVKTYTLSGTLLSEETFSDIKKRILNGITRNYFPDGKLKAEINFKDGVYNGPLRTFYPNERIKRAELFEKGNPVKGKCFSNAAMIPLIML
jgi:antitoxin component YwqK of YwqJK toxin-antitoxin module